MKEKLIDFAGILFLTICLNACSNSADTKTVDNSEKKADSTASAEPVKGNPVSLFDGKSLSGWHGYNNTGEVKNWKIEDSAMVCLGAAKDAHGGDLSSDKVYENFELSWQWKVTKGGNSGVMYHVVEDAKYKAPYETGPEYQMIDDIGFSEKLQDWQKSGADYAMNLANDKKKLMPVGEWNASKIIFNRGHVEHWLNGEKIVEFQAWDDKWNKEKKEGKWKDYPDYGIAKNGHIALQDHGHKVYFKNILITEL
ncbi:MAG: family 16 glycoside hydrolase [Ferruginibacter sp.]